jgi:hypothetical protein
MCQEKLNARVFKELYLGRKEDHIRIQLQAEGIRHYQINDAFSFVQRNDILRSLKLV